MILCTETQTINLEGNIPCNNIREFSRDYSLDCLCRHLIPTVIKASGSSKTWDCLPKQWGRDQGNNDASQLHQPFNGHVLFRWQLLSKRRRRRRHADANMTPLWRRTDAKKRRRRAALQVWSCRHTPCMTQPFTLWNLTENSLIGMYASQSIYF